MARRERGDSNLWAIAGCMKTEAGAEPYLYLEVRSQIVGCGVPRARSRQWPKPSDNIQVTFRSVCTARNESWATEVRTRWTETERSGSQAWGRWARPWD